MKFILLYNILYSECAKNFIKDNGNSQMKNSELNILNKNGVENYQKNIKIKWNLHYEVHKKQVVRRSENFEQKMLEFNELPSTILKASEESMDLKLNLFSDPMISGKNANNKFFNNPRLDSSSDELSSINHVLNHKKIIEDYTVSYLTSNFDDYDIFPEFDSLALQEKIDECSKKGNDLENKEDLSNFKDSLYKNNYH